MESIADAYRFELLPFAIDSIVVEPGIYRTPIFDRIFKPADEERLASYGRSGEFAGRVVDVFQTAISAPDAPGSEEVAKAFVQLIEMDARERPFRTIVSPPLQQLLEPYNAAAEELRPIVAQMFNVPELAGLGRAASAAE